MTRPAPPARCFTSGHRPQRARARRATAPPHAVARAAPFRQLQRDESADSATAAPRLSRERLAAPNTIALPTAASRARARRSPAADPLRPGGSGTRPTQRGKRLPTCCLNACDSSMYLRERLSSELGWDPRRSWEGHLSDLLGYRPLGDIGGQLRQRGISVERSSEPPHPVAAADARPEWPAAAQRTLKCSPRGDRDAALLWLMPMREQEGPHAAMLAPGSVPGYRVDPLTASLTRSMATRRTQR
jgi:hypothetical protein